MIVNKDHWPFVGDGSSNDSNLVWDYLGESKNMGYLAEQQFHDMKLKEVEMQLKDIDKKIMLHGEELMRMIEEKNRLTQLLRQNLREDISPQERDIAQQMNDITTQKRDIAQFPLKIAQQSNASDLNFIPPMPLQTRGLLQRGSSGIRESGCPPKTHNNNYHSILSSPVDHFNTVTFPSISNLVNTSQNFGMERPLSRLPKTDMGSMVIKALASGKPLPENGKLLQAVLAIGMPVLEMRPLPKWKTPLTQQKFQVAPPTLIDYASPQHELSRGGACISVDSATMSGVSEDPSWPLVSRYRALSAKRQ